MRISVVETDPGYRPDVFERLYEAFVDGVKVERCITADEEQGFAIRFRSGDDGGYVLNEAKDELLKDTLRGIVTITVRDRD